ncbi:MAG: hypothetical protein GY759_09075 [Chloroflexi bacterium]|nr:hypothetical protein [Chloroflexota bacterium]
MSEPNYHLLSLNSKLKKVLEIYVNVMIAGLALAPHMTSGYNTCLGAGWCTTVCNLWFSGRTVTDVVRNAMINRTLMFFENRDLFFHLLWCDLDAMQAEAVETDSYAFVRPNVASDIDWTRFGLMERYPYINFYDYCKIRSRIEAYAHGDMPDNYHITASYNEKMKDTDVWRWLNMGVNVAVVFDTPYNGQHKHITKPLPTEWKRFEGIEVVNGDKHDIRHPDYDGRGKLIALAFKGMKAEMPAAIENGFVIRDERYEAWM